MSGAVRVATRTTGELLVTAGVLVLLFGVWQLWWTGVGASRDQEAALRHLSSSWTHGPPPRPSPSGAAGGDAGTTGAPTAPAGDPPVLAEPSPGTDFAIVHVPRFGSGWSVAASQGTDLRRVLDRGVLGHYAGTAMPGAVGNFAVAGHRTTYGHPMNQIAELVEGDPVVVETADAWFVYRVSGHEVVPPTDVAVIAPVPGSPGAAPTQRTITITACHPEYSARQRYVVHGVLQSWQPRAAGAPAVLDAGGGS